VSYFTLIFNKGSFFALLTVTTFMTGYSFLDPILEPRMEEEKLDSDYASIFFITIALTFCISCHITPWFSA